MYGNVQVGKYMKKMFLGSRRHNRLVKMKYLNRIKIDLFHS